MRLVVINHLTLDGESTPTTTGVIIATYQPER
jgi:hypothetical protein